MDKLLFKLDPETGTFTPGVVAAVTASVDGQPAQADLLSANRDELSQFNIARIGRQLTDFEVFGVPAGKAVGALGVAGFFDVFSHFAEPLIPRTGVLTEGARRGVLLFLGAAFFQWDPVKTFFGAQISDASSLILTADGLLTTFNARKFITDMFRRFFPQLASHAGRALGSEFEPTPALASGHRNNGREIITSSTVPTRASITGV